MKSITLNLTNEQSEVVQELLEKALNEQSGIISNTNSTSHEYKRAQFQSKCIRLLLQALQQGYTIVNMPDMLMKPVLSQLKITLESQMAIMTDLMQDESLVQENQVQVIRRSMELLSVLKTMTYEVLQNNKEVTR